MGVNSIHEGFDFTSADVLGEFTIGCNSLKMLNAPAGACEVHQRVPMSSEMQLNFTVILPLAQNKYIK